jgi:xanthine dehydrogenase accessory factor
VEERLAVATVVRRCEPISSHVGDRAVVHADGRMEGFVGGACSRDIVRRQAIAALRAGRPRLVRIRPDALRTSEDGDVVTVPMTCVSEGAVDVYIEPRLPKRRLLVAGYTPVCDALVHLASIMDFDVVRFVEQGELRDAQSDGVQVFSIESLRGFLNHLDPDLRASAVAIAASQGHYDEDALGAFLEHDLSFTGLLASPRRAAAIEHLLSAKGVPQARLSKIHAPVGLAIGARKPADVAVSILAEIIAETEKAPSLAAETAAVEIAADPVCGMEVDAHTQHRASVGENEYVFCSAHCRAAFLANPQQYLIAGT